MSYTQKITQEVQELFSIHRSGQFETLEKDHGRIETRNCYVIKNLTKMKVAKIEGAYNQL